MRGCFSLFSRLLRVRCGFVQSLIDSARIVREQEGRWKSCCDVQRLEANTGLTWEEISLAQLDAQAITETTLGITPAPASTAAGNSRR